MLNRNIGLAAGWLMIAIATAQEARAQWAVVDAPATAQLIQQVQNMQKQLAIAGSQLQSTQLSLQAMTGGRGMGQLLGGITRNYLPANWTQVTNAAQGQRTSGYPGLSADVQGAIGANAILSQQRLSTLSPAIYSKFKQLDGRALCSRHSQMRRWQTRAAGSRQYNR